MPKSAETLRMNESELVVRAKTGCSQAMADLVRAHHRELRGFLVRRVGNLTVADDLAQEVFLAAIRQIGDFADDQNFRAWMFTVARNKSVDFLRSVKREKTHENDVEVLLVEESISRLKIQNDLDHESLLGSLRDCISKLNPKARSLVESIYFENISAEQIAKKTNRKSNAIRMSVLRIRKALASCIRRHMGSEFEL